MTHAPRLAMLLVLFGCLAACLGSGGCASRGSHPAQQEGVRYTVVEGDTLLAISSRYDVPIQDIVRANHLRDRELHPGQSLLLPGVTIFAQPEPASGPVVDEPVDDDDSWYIPRSEWSVQSIDLSNIDPMTPIYRLTVHHSSEQGDALEDPVEMLRMIERNHKAGTRTSPPWACIGYHFIIAKDGRVFEGRPLAYQGAHAVGDNNIGNIGVCLLGDFEHGTVPQAQRDALVATLDRLCARYAIDRDQIFGHREFKKTDCPGRYLMAIVEQYRGSSEGEVGPADTYVPPSARPKKKPAAAAAKTTKTAKTAKKPVRRSAVPQP
jgi:hypothetical protein